MHAAIIPEVDRKALVDDGAPAIRIKSR